MTKKQKNIALLVAATVIPFGFVALGIWKAYEIYKTGEKKNEDKVKILET